MRRIFFRLIAAIVLFSVLTGCGPSPASPEPSVEPMAPTGTFQLPHGETLLVANTADSGSGSLRQVLLDAQMGDIIAFDPTVFPPGEPATILLASGLPPLSQGGLMIDASNAGVILDGRNIVGGEWVCGLTIVSDHNTIQGLKIVNFSGAGILLEGANHNTVGGDRTTGSGPIGQGNMICQNSDGIGLMDSSNNRIEGNLIGTDVAGAETCGNQNPGIFVEGDSNANRIGPNNIIANNGDHGIDVRGLYAAQNSITQNSIYDNLGSGINVQVTDDLRVDPPIILDHDLELGFLAGVTCPNCIVEIFSDDDCDGEIYEGYTSADSAGAFSFQNDTPFTGPQITTTATDVEGGTSEISPPTSGIRRQLVLQDGNDFLRSQIQTLPSSELTDNRIGAFWDGVSFSQGAMQETIDLEILPIGLKRVRLALNGISWDTVNWDRPELTIDPRDDEVISRIAENGITITYVLTFWDKNTWPGGERERQPRFKTEGEIQRYLDFVRFIVGHFKDRIQYYELWNEPDVVCEDSNPEVCVQAIEVDDYIDLTRKAVAAIREVYPEAKIVVGGTCYLIEPHAREYLFHILRSDIMPQVDVVSWHGMYGTSPDDLYHNERSIRQYYYDYPTLIQQVRDEARAHGFNGEFRSDEIIWRTEEIFFSNEPWIYSEKVATKYCARGILTHLGNDVSLTMAVHAKLTQYLHMQRCLCTLLAGAEPTTLPVAIQSEATQVAYYSFSLPNGDILVALWADGVAVEDDPGIPVTVSIPGISAHGAAGMDVLYGYEQQMVVRMEDGSLIIDDLILKDYPIILRITPAGAP
jgi:hypothetical protein